jgi:hypothetical protein
MEKFGENTVKQRGNLSEEWKMEELGNEMMKKGGRSGSGLEDGDDWTGTDEDRRKHWKIVQNQPQNLLPLLVKFRNCLKPFDLLRSVFDVSPASRFTFLHLSQGFTLQSCPVPCGPSRTGSPSRCG